MIYLDNGATSLPKAPGVREAVAAALERCGNPGRGCHAAAMAAAEIVYGCREEAAALFHCRPEQAVMTCSCTHGLNLAIRSLVKPGDPVVISGFEHNAVTRTLHALGAEIHTAGRKLFDWEDTLGEFDRLLTEKVRAAVVTQVSNVFGYILPVGEISRMCRERGIPLILDAAQGAGTEALDFEKLHAAYVAMPGHKGLLGPQGTGLLLCREPGVPLMTGGTGSRSQDPEMPDFLPDCLEAGTLNVPGIAGLRAGLRFVRKMGPQTLGRREAELAAAAAKGLRALGAKVFSGPHQSGTVSFLTNLDCEAAAEALSRMGFALRPGLHCAPLAHRSAGTESTGTIRASVGWNGKTEEINDFLTAVSKLSPGEA